jgi:hypothetical protein
MRDYSLYSPPLLFNPRPATEVGVTFTPTFYLPVMQETLGLIYGALAYLDRVSHFTGTEVEIEGALNVVREQSHAYALTLQEICKG